MTINKVDRAINKNEYRKRAGRKPCDLSLAKNYDEDVKFSNRVIMYSAHKQMCIRSNFYGMLIMIMRSTRNQDYVKSMLLVRFRADQRLST